MTTDAVWFLSVVKYVLTKLMISSFLLCRARSVHHLGSRKNGQEQNSDDCKMIWIIWKSEIIALHCFQLARCCKQMSAEKYIPTKLMMPAFQRYPAHPVRHRRTPDTIEDHSGYYCRCEVKYSESKYSKISGTSWIHSILYEFKTICTFSHISIFHEL